MFLSHKLILIISFVVERAVGTGSSSSNLEMRDNDPEVMLEVDMKATESFLNQRTLQLESYEMSQHTQEQHAAVWPCNHLAGASCYQVCIRWRNAALFTCEGSDFAMSGLFSTIAVGEETWKEI